MIPRKLSVDEISFGAHVDYSQNSEFIEAVNAQHIVSCFLFSMYSAHYLTAGACPWRAKRNGSSASCDAGPLQEPR